MKGENLYEKIEAYLNGALAADALKVFEEEMANDASLLAEVNLHRRLQNELGKSNKKILQDNLKIISAKQQISLEGSDIEAKKSKDKSTNRSWLLPLIFGALVILAGLYFINKGNKEVPPTTAPDRELELQQDTPTELPESNQKKLPQATNEKADEKSTNEEPLIASIDPNDFVPNPYLDSQIGSQVRGENYSVTLDESGTAEKITLNGNIAQLRLKGFLKTKGALAEGTTFVLMIYSNKKEDYLEERPILNVPINLQPLKEDAFPFQFNANMRITPGLYYYIIAEKNNDEPLHVGRFEVVPPEK